MPYTIFNETKNVEKFINSKITCVWSQSGKISKNNEREREREGGFSLSLSLSLSLSRK